MTEMGEDYWGRELSRMIPRIRDLAARQDIEPIADGSQLARDDKDYPRLPTSTLAWVGLNAATEHLSMAADLLTGNNPAAYPTAYQTLCRSAMLGAGQAIWLMTGSARERTHRSRLIALDERKNYRIFLWDWVNDPFLTAEVSPEAMDKARDVVKRLDAEMKVLRERMQGDGRKGREQDFTATRMLKDVASYLTQQEGDWLRISNGWQWRMGSGDAHARAWPSHVRGGEIVPIPEDRGGGRARVSTGSASQIGMAVATALIATHEAFVLWDLRRAVPAVTDPAG